jgi:hypothetical protein
VWGDESAVNPELEKLLLAVQRDFEDDDDDDDDVDDDYGYSDEDMAVDGGAGSPFVTGGKSMSHSLREPSSCTSDVLSSAREHSTESYDLETDCAPEERESHHLSSAPAVPKGVGSNSSVDERIYRLSLLDSTSLPSSTRQQSWFVSRTGTPPLESSNVNSSKDKTQPQISTPIVQAFCDGTDPCKLKSYINEVSQNVNDSPSPVSSRTIQGERQRLKLSPRSLQCLSKILASCPQYPCALVDPFADEGLAETGDVGHGSGCVGGGEGGGGKRVNLDITTLITLVSSVCHGGCYLRFEDKVRQM